jgi:hypothetical protein
MKAALSSAGLFGVGGLPPRVAGIGVNVHTAALGCSRYTALLRRAGVACCHPWPFTE